MAMQHPRPSKRPRRKVSKLSSTTALSNSDQCPTSTSSCHEEESPGTTTTSLNNLLLQKRWDEAMAQLEEKETRYGLQEAADLRIRPSALAMACRQGAPADLIKQLLLAAPHRLRELLDSRGTPLHEAISCDNTSMETLRALLRTDELLDDHLEEQQDEDAAAELMMIIPSTRATLMQDVDGYTPLHLLIRRRFQWHVLTTEEVNDLMMPMLEALVQSCPESVLVPDRGEYEEPPIVYALKANIYAPAFADGEAHFVTVEARIYDMVQMMLQYAPIAAAQAFSGFRGDYTALHSAVFHGRYTNTMELLLDTEASVNAESQQLHKAALLKNTQAELPLHFWYVVC
jgi:hypothetical protein